MNLSLKNRVGASFIIANMVVLVIGFAMFFYLDSLNKDIENISVKTNRLTLLTDEIRISAVSILKYQRRILARKATPELVEKLISLCDGFTSQLQQLDSEYNEVEVKKIIAKMLGYVDSLKLILSKASLFHRDTVGLSSIGDLADKILEAFTEFQDIQRIQSDERDRRVKQIISDTKRNMMITLIITFFGTILLGLIVPGKIALPFKKINDAIRELQECNFDVSIYYNQDDEIGEIAKEMNKMISSIKHFEELRTDRISVELKKFDTLASMVRKYILVANAKGQLTYMNNGMYSLLQVQSDDVLNKNLSELLVPPSIKEAYELAIKRRSKIENHEIEITRKRDFSEDDHRVESNEILNESGDVVDEGKKIPDLEVIFQGYAQVVPIRGKDSSLDYYLMVLSTEVFS